MSPPARRRFAAELREQVEREVSQALEPAPSAPKDLYISQVAAGDVAGCPARYRALGEEGWGFPGWSPPLAAGSVARTALAHHLWLHSPPPQSDQPGPVPLLDPVRCVRAWMKDTFQARSQSPVGDWLKAVREEAGGTAILAATTARSSRWLGGFLRLWGWPLPSSMRLLSDDASNPTALRWQKRSRLGGSARGVTVAGSPDALLGSVASDAGYGLVIHRSGSPSQDGLLGRAAFEVTAASLSAGEAPAAVRFSLGDTGQQLNVPVDDDLLARGVGLIVAVVQQRVAAMAPLERSNANWIDAAPSPGCRHCPFATDCEPGQRWLAGPGRWQGGLPAA